MKRTISTQLRTWKESNERKPLLLEGARQVGKTYSLLKFGESDFAAHHHFDFERSPALRGVFESDLKPSRIIEALSAHSRQRIDPARELLIFDEVQKAPRALTALKYISQDHPDWFIAATGSLLGVGLGEASFPVGQVKRLRMYPMTFIEFLLGTGNEILAEAIQHPRWEEAQVELVHQEIWQELKTYLITGGLPDVVKTLRNYSGDLPAAYNQVRERQSEILQDYQDDIAKHSGKLKAVKINAVLESVPAQLARESIGVRKFVFKQVFERNSKYAELEAPIHWLIRAGLVHKIPICDQIRIPLKAHCDDSRFILYLFDVGMLGAMTDLSPYAIRDYNYGSYKGYFAENFVLQEMVSSGNVSLFSWQENTSQIEFLLSSGEDVFPIEVKAGVSTKAKSLGIFQQKYSPKSAYLLSGKAYKPCTRNRQMLPLYYACQLQELIRQ